MNGETYNQLRVFQAAANALRQIVPALPPTPTISRNRRPWPAIDEARYFCEQTGRDSPTHQAPHAYARWHRLAWRAVVVAAYEAAGQGLACDELARLDRMTTPELADELTYLADYQG